MGILNVTPDSFADGGLYIDPGAAEAAAVEMEARGADLIDVGGESTRPGSDTITADEEIARIRPVIERLARSIAIPISIDTSKPAVAEVAIGEGASIINDVTGLRGASGTSEGGAPRALRYDASLAEIAARSGAGLILMHARGRSRDMYKDANYASVPHEVGEELRASLERALSAGARQRLSGARPWPRIRQTARAQLRGARRPAVVRSARVPVVGRTVAQVVSHGGHRRACHGRARHGDGCVGRGGGSPGRAHRARAQCAGHGRRGAGR